MIITWSDENMNKIYILMSYLSTIIIGTLLYNKCPKGIEALRVFLSSFLVTFSSFFYLANKRKKKKVQKIL